MSNSSGRTGLNSWRTFRRWPDVGWTVETEELEEDTTEKRLQTEERLELVPPALNAKEKGLAIGIGIGANGRGNVPDSR